MKKANKTSMHSKGKSSFDKAQVMANTARSGQLSTNCSHIHNQSASLVTLGRLPKATYPKKIPLTLNKASKKPVKSL